ncbi:MAG: histidine kinase [Bryobacterales bacterium]|nr:histidine kinase [Bryobacterales bacterium]
MIAPTEPLLANLLGYSAGTLVFGLFSALLLQDREGRRLPGSRLTLAAAAMALLWNGGSLALQFTGSTALMVVTTSALSLLPALLLDLLLRRSLRWIAWCGYALSATAMALHASEGLFNVEDLHSLTLVATAAGFALLTASAGVALYRAQVTARQPLGAMALFLFALSFAHFHNEGAAHAWPAELAIHHAGIPIALFVLLQEYRFVLLDAFVRILANTLIAGVFTWGAAQTARAFGWLDTSAMAPTRLALMAIACCGTLVLFAVARGGAQTLLTRLIFRRGDAGLLLERLRKAPLESETLYLDWAWGEIAQFFNAERTPVGVGRRSGGQPYLSEDLELLAKLESQINERLEQFREGELRRLVSQAEFRALQAQIHPHFLFNAFNTLYGIIPKEAAGARRTVLNLADIFRYFLRTERHTIALEEEMQIVRAYLEIESLRVGPKLRIEIDVDAAAQRVSIPVLSVQPLVENAVKHGIAPQAAGGTVRVVARIEEGQLALRVSDTGPGFSGTPAHDGAGVGLDNVRQRLRLCYGAAAILEMERCGAETVVGFHAPVTER